MSLAAASILAVAVPEAPIQILVQVGSTPAQEVPAQVAPAQEVPVGLILTARDPIPVVVAEAVTLTEDRSHLRVVLALCRAAPSPPAQAAPVPVASRSALAQVAVRAFRGRA